MNPRSLFSLYPVLALSLFITALICRESLAAEGTGTVTGKVAPVAGFIDGNVRAYQLDGPASLFGGAIKSNGQYSLKLPPGNFAIVQSMFGKRGPVSTLAFATVKEGKRVSAKTPKRKATANATSETRISVGNLQARGPNGETYKNINGKPIVYDDALITDLVLTNKACNIAVFEDRKFGRFQDIVKELRRQSSDLFAKPINLKAALKTLNANAPQFRITGSIGVLNSSLESSGTAEIQIVDLKTGAIISSESMTGLPPTLEGLFPAIAEKVVNSLCIPTHIRGTFTGTQEVKQPNVNVLYEWQGSAVFVLQTRIPNDPERPTTLNGALYAIESFQIDSFRRSGTVGNCSVLVEAGLTAPQPPSTGAMFLYLEPVSGLGYRYDLSVNLIALNAATQVMTCPTGTEISPHEVTADLVVSSDADNLPYTPSLNSFEGSSAVDTSDFQWNFVGTK